jgi:FKBP-type peptidyl-prolyl cis-trans isomerase
LAACGGGSSTTQSSSNAAKSTTEPEKPGGGQKSGAALTEVAGTKTPPRVQVPQGPPPKKLVVNDLKKGPGAVVAPGKIIRTQFIGVNYKTGKLFEIDWGKTGTFSFTFGSGEAIDGWEIGLKGMKVGGRRELIVPSKLAYNTGPLVYVMELIAIE